MDGTTTYHLAVALRDALIALGVSAPQRRSPGGHCQNECTERPASCQGRGATRRGVAQARTASHNSMFGTHYPSAAARSLPASQEGTLLSYRSRHVGPGRIRLGIVLLLCSIMLVTPLTAFAASSATATDDVNLRSGPGLNYRVLTLLPAGATLSVTGAASEGWYPVRYNDVDGWAYAEYIALAGEAQGTAATTGGAGVRGTATVVTNLLNMRGGPGTSYGVVAQLPYGTTVQIVGDPQAGDGRTWVEVVAKGAGLGWIAAEFLDAGEAPRAAQPAAAPVTASAPAPAPTAAPASSGDSVTDIITAAANRYDQSPSAMLAVARCESHLDPTAVNSRSGAAGLFQFLPGTWRTTPYAAYSIFDPWANANAAGWMWAAGRRGEWVC